MRFVHSVTISSPRPPGDQSPGYRAMPHQWGLKAGFSQRCCVARTFHVRAGCANLLPPRLVVDHRDGDRSVCDRAARLLRCARNDKEGCHCEERSDEAISTCQNFRGHLLNQDAKDWHTPPGHEVSGLQSSAPSMGLLSWLEPALLCSPASDRRAAKGPH